MLIGKSRIKTEFVLQAAQAACSQMGNRKFYDLMIFDTLQQETRGKVTDPNYVFSLRDYMQVNQLYYIPWTWIKEIYTNYPEMLS